MNISQHCFVPLTPYVSGSWSATGQPQSSPTAYRTTVLLPFSGSNCFSFYGSLRQAIRLRTFDSDEGGQSVSNISNADEGFPVFAIGGSYYGLHTATRPLFQTPILIY